MKFQLAAKYTIEAPTLRAAFKQLEEYFAECQRALDQSESNGGSEVYFSSPLQGRGNFTIRQVNGKSVSILNLGTPK